MRFAGFIGPSYTLKSKNADCQRCINLYPEVNEIGTGKAKEVAALVSTPGLNLLCTIGDGPIRAQFTASNGALYVVSSSKLYSVSNSFVATEIGTLNSSTGLVSVADNGTDMVLVDGTFGYKVTLADNTFAQILDAEFEPASQVVYQDGYLIFVKTNSRQFFISGLNAVTFDGADFATKEGFPDNIVGIISDHRDLFLFGEQTIEVFYNSGEADFPFARAQNAYIEHGCAARFSIAKMNNAVFWLGKDDKGSGIVYSAQGYQPQRISTHAVEIAIQSYAEIADAVAYTYQENGHYFYVLNFPTADTTWVYDSATNLWHERMYLSNGLLERHRSNLFTIAHSKRVVADWENGNLYEMSSEFTTDAGIPVLRRRVAPHLTSDLNIMFHHEFTLDMETGVGLNEVVQGYNPKVMLRFSDDGGHSWSNEKWADAGKLGKRLTRVRWHRLGISRDRVYEITVTDPVSVTLLGAELRVAAGAT